MFKTIFRSLIFIMLAPLLLNAVDSNEKKETPPEFDKLWNYSDPALTEKTFQEIYLKSKETESNTYLAQLLSQIARSQGLQGNFDAGFKTIIAAEEISEENDRLAEVRILLETGRLNNSSGSRETAREFFWEAKELAVAEGFDLYAIDAVHMLGIVDPPEKQLEWNMLAIEMTEETDDKRAKGWLGPLLNNTGWSYFDLGEYDKALELFRKSLKWREEIEDESGTRIAKWTIARTLRAMKDHEKALEIQLELAREIEDKGISPDGYVYEELGELYLINDDIINAKHYFGLAYPLLSTDPWLQKNEAARLERIKELIH
jgi:tetratricopeptide (TPR) repeat protein